MTLDQSNATVLLLCYDRTAWIGQLILNLNLKSSYDAQHKFFAKLNTILLRTRSEHHCLDRDQLYASKAEFIPCQLLVFQTIATRSNPLHGEVGMKITIT